MGLDLSQIGEIRNAETICSTESYSLVKFVGDKGTLVSIRESLKGQYLSDIFFKELLSETDNERMTSLFFKIVECSKENNPLLFSRFKDDLVGDVNLSHLGWNFEVYDDSHKRALNRLGSLIKKIVKLDTYDDGSKMTDSTKLGFVFNVVAAIELGGKVVDILKMHECLISEKNDKEESSIEQFGYYLLVSNLWQKTTKEAYESASLPRVVINMEYFEESWEILHDSRYTDDEAIKMVHEITDDKS